MSKTVSVFTIIIVTASISESQQQIVNLLNTNFKNFFGVKVENDEKNNRGMDEISRRDQGERELKQHQGASSNVNEQLHGLENLIHRDLQYNRNEPQSSLLQSQYSVLARKRHPNPSKTDESLRADGVPRLYDPMETGIKHVYIESDESLRTRRPLDINSQEPGDGEGWYNYPITPIAGPNPAWHMSTLRRIYQRPHRIVKRSPKRRSKKKKKTRDERKKFNKKKRVRRKMRILKSRKDKPKKKKGDGSYRGGRGRKPRMHRKPGNRTLSSTENVTDYYTEESETDEGPVADAYIDYDSSYVPPSKEQEFSDDKYVVKQTSDEDVDSKSDKDSAKTKDKSEGDKSKSEKDSKSKSKSSGESSSDSGKKRKKKVKPRRMKILRKKRPKNKKKKSFIKTENKQYRASSKTVNHLSLNRRESFNINPNIKKSKLIAQKTKPHTIVETIINQLKLQQMQNVANDENFHASILLHPLDDDVPQSYGTGNRNIQRTPIKTENALFNQHLLNIDEVGETIDNRQKTLKTKSDTLTQKLNNNEFDQNKKVKTKSF